MMEILCNCDWGLGVELPHHSHMVISHVRARDDHYDGWINAWLKEANNEHFEVLAEIEEIRFYVPWKELYRRGY